MGANSDIRPLPNISYFLRQVLSERPPSPYIPLPNLTATEGLHLAGESWSCRGHDGGSSKGEGFNADIRKVILFQVLDRFGKPSALP